MTTDQSCRPQILAQSVPEGVYMSEGVYIPEGVYMEGPIQVGSA